jgi:hypothetical protein
VHMYGRKLGGMNTALLHAVGSAHVTCTCLMVMDCGASALTCRIMHGTPLTLHTALPCLTTLPMRYAAVWGWLPCTGGALPFKRLC